MGGGSTGRRSAEAEASAGQRRGRERRGHDLTAGGGHRWNEGETEGGREGGRREGGRSLTFGARTTCSRAFGLLDDGQLIRQLPALLRDPRRRADGLLAGRRDAGDGGHCFVASAGTPETLLRLRPLTDGSAHDGRVDIQERSARPRSSSLQSASEESVLLSSRRSRGDADTIQMVGAVASSSIRVHGARQLRPGISTTKKIRKSENVVEPVVAVVHQSPQMPSRPMVCTSRTFVDEEESCYGG